MTDTAKLKSLILGLEGKNTFSRLEPLMPDIDRKIKEGVPRAELHKLITEQGIEISEGVFYTYLYRYRKKVGGKGLEKKQNGNSAPAQGVAPKTEVAATVGNTPEPELVESRGGPVAEPASDDLPEDFLSNPAAREKFAEQLIANSQNKVGLRRKK